MSKNSSEKSALPKLRKAFTIIVLLNTAFLIERMTFDFLGFMFSMIIADFLYLMFLLIGIFGVIQFRVNYIVSLTLTSMIWIAWNIFIICVYLDIGNLNRYDPVFLNLNTGKTSWWLTSNFGCSVEIFNELEKLQIQEQLDSANALYAEKANSTIYSQENFIYSFVSFNSDSKYKYLNNFISSNCLIPFYLIEIIHSSIMILKAILIIIFGLLVSNALNEEDDSFDYIGGFDTTHMLSQNLNLDTETLPRSGHIRLEPLYA
ncbi:sodium potassium-transporting ATPase subunit beta-1-interacting 4 isoform X1 [Brachionus plicatilis]|uniref:Sodium/potassium-transporting ATPase subunit beta-1-interacting protein n=1 Tax=Brachionus plicatilis TaxID=10195 RepID=A0A3M7T9F9_BRAPC|nr:sodium potassium-transporting ATPase subunit beta-1-interacting 4 isoform X1 [Brachionus plicatilis]